ncbi:hypothetical protein EA473_14810 [Natrarchaeobius chitinivorans]|uniref:DUF8159 domain-containing protein n=2 Tax=Natrarchaeobius chitinivorans TaxID=1679083 RepID=A0A3N6M027_NATCH|nr:hypothetical protein EA473_14810 [Natrarchaeobius chitinivorans]
MGGAADAFFTYWCEGSDRMAEPGNTNRGTQLTRRRALAVAGTVSLGTTAGCLDSIQGIGGGRTEIEPTEPDDRDDSGTDGDHVPTYGEFYHHLEDAGITVDELYHDTDDDDLILFYESDAETRDESDNEIAQIYIIFRDELVARGSDVNHMYTEVIGGFDGQVDGWGINSEWAEDDLAGVAEPIDVWNAIVDTMVYEGDSDRYDLPEDSTDQ